MADLPLIAKLRATTAVGDEDAASLARICLTVEPVARRRDIISEGEKPEYVHLVTEGWAARYRILPNGSRQITAFLIPGDFCDLHATVLSAMDHGVIALTNCEIGYIDADKLNQLIDTRPAIARAIWRSTLVDEAILREWIVNVGRRDALQTTAHLLCELHLRLGIVGLVKGDSFTLPVTQEELGDATGMTAVHMNRTLGELRSRGLVEASGHDLRVLDLERLRRLAGFSEKYLHLRSSP